MQITESQNAGPPVPIAGATLPDWRILATQRFSILAKAWLTQGGTTAVQLTNFTAEPMSRLYEQTFYCDMSRLYDDFGGYCCRYAAGFGDVELRFITTNRDNAAYIDTKTTTPRLLYILRVTTAMEALF